MVTPTLTLPLRGEQLTALLASHAVAWISQVRSAAIASAWFPPIPGVVLAWFVCPNGELSLALWRDPATRSPDEQEDIGTRPGRQLRRGHALLIVLRNLNDGMRRARRITAT
jgi:hypothetical protein